MNELNSKLREVGGSILPIILLVLILIIGPVSVSWLVFWRFIIGAFCLFTGLSLFLWGVDQSMNPIGYHLAGEVGSSSGLLKAALMSFGLGFIVTFAEPDLTILGKQVELASGGQIGAKFLIWMVSLGVGIMIAIGAIRNLKNKKLKNFMGLSYGIIILLSLWVSSEYMAISFDASGATTGALTTPFILALSIGLSRLKGSSHAEDDSFGLVGVMSAGPILAVSLIALFGGRGQIAGDLPTGDFGAGIFGPLARALPHTLKDALLALLPLALIFFIFERRKFRLPRREIIDIVRGLVYSLLGLTLFIVGAETGFMEMGRLLGAGLAQFDQHILPLIGLLIGLIVVLAEPAVHVLGQQIESVTSGRIPQRTIRLTLSIGVGIAVSLSLLRIITPSVQLWYFLLPGFALVVLLSFYAEPIFVGIAYDAGGVASGPMAATFVLAFAQGAAAHVPTADVMVDGFGIIAMIAMTPVLSLMLLGSYYRFQKERAAAAPTVDMAVTAAPALNLPAGERPEKDLILCSCDFGGADAVVALARAHGAHGATILHGRDTRAEALARYSLRYVGEQELVLLVVARAISSDVYTALDAARRAENQEGIRSLSIIPVAYNSLMTSRVQKESQLEPNSKTE